MREEQPRSRRGNRQITEKEADDVEEMSSPRTPVIYEVVRRLGDEEMDRPITSLWWSGVAAGLSISFSLLAEAVLQSYLPESSWRVLITSLGYCVGFVMAVLSRQQLFTETPSPQCCPSRLILRRPISGGSAGSGVLSWLRTWPARSSRRCSVPSLPY